MSAHRGSFWTRYVFSRDHKVIAMQYYVTALVMGVVGGMLAMLIRLQVAWPAESWPPASACRRPSRSRC